MINFTKTNCIKSIHYTYRQNDCKAHGKYQVIMAITES